MYLKLSEIFKYLNATPDSRCIVEGEQVLHAKHLILCGKKSFTKESIHLVGLCLQTSALQGQPHQIEGILKLGENVTIGEMKCSCKAGLSGTCKHVSALLLNCTRMELSNLEVLSSTDVECHWKKAKSDAKDLYTPKPICEFPCLASTSNKLKRVRDLSNDEMKDCLKIIMEAGPDTNLNRHYLRRRKQILLGASTSSSTVLLEINNIFAFFQNSEFLHNLSKEILVEKYSLKDCCREKWNKIKNYDGLKSLLLAQDSKEWHEIRRFRITGSNCYSIFTYNINNNEECWERKTNQCFFPKKFSNKYVVHGKNEEKNAISAYESSTHLNVVSNLGIIIPKHFPWLGFSSDALVLDKGIPVKLLEIKCPFIGKTKDVEHFITTCSYLKVLPSGLELNKKHSYYGQIQLGLALSNLKTCDFLVYSSFSNSFLKLEVEFDEEFTKKMIASITEKYFRKMLHMLCNTT